MDKKAPKQKPKTVKKAKAVAKAVAKKRNSTRKLKKLLASKKQLKLSHLSSCLKDILERYEELDDPALVGLYDYLILSLHEGFKKDFESIKDSEPFIYSTAVDNHLTEENDLNDSEAVTDYIENLIAFVDTLKDKMEYTPKILDTRFKKVFHHNLKAAKRVILKQKNAPMNENAPKEEKPHMNENAANKGNKGNKGNNGMNELGDLFAGMGGIGHKPDVMLKAIDDLEALMGKFGI